jgi:glycine/serine hydroxymethyltransferase
MFERNRYTVDEIDPEICAAIEKENQRQEDHIELIASENYTSSARQHSANAALHAPRIQIFETCI